MKKTLFAVLMLAVTPVLQAVNEVAPVLEINGAVEILMLDGSARRVRKIMGMSVDELRVMTDDGISKIPLATLHPQSIAKLNSMMESPAEREVRLQREAAAAASYRQNQDLRERMAAAENAMIGESQRAEAARQEVARQAAAAAYAQQQQAAQEMLRLQDAQKAERRAERAERIAMADREDREQYEREVAAANAANAAAIAANAPPMPQNTPGQPAAPGPLAAMMPAHVRVTSGVDKVDMNDQNALKAWVDMPSMNAPATNTWGQNLETHERQVLAAWMNQKRFSNLSPAMQAQVRGPDLPHIQLPVDSSINGFVGFEQGRVYRLANNQSWQQMDNKTVNFYRDVTGNSAKVHIRANGGNYFMSVEGAGEIWVKPVAN